jgi:iron(III) transport system substrate-binding protein
MRIITATLVSAAMSALALAVGVAAAVPAHAADQALIDAAKKEGKVVWYTGLGITEAAKPLFDAFMKKYPGIQVDAARYTAPDILLRVQNEAQAKNYVVDVADGTATVPALVTGNFLDKYVPEPAAKYPPELKDPNGLWVAGWQFFRAVGYNTDMIPKDQVPKTYEDLLNPRWKGAMAWADDPAMIGPPGFIYSVLTQMGEEKGTEYLKKLATQNIAKVPASELVVIGQVLEGQYAINLTTLTHHFLLPQYRKAPGAWIKLEPISQIVNAIGLVKNAPHPNAGKLLIDFILSDEGQGILRDAGYIPANPAVPALDPSLKPETGNFKAQPILPPDTIEKLPAMVKVYRDIFK